MKIPAHHTEPIPNLRRPILQAVASREGRILPRDLEKRIVQTEGIHRRDYQTALKELMAEGELTYTNVNGCTFVEKSFNRPVRVGAHIILTPAERHPATGESDIVIRLQPGASFGCGQHPTTRLAVQGIEYAVRTLGIGIGISRSTLLDIGTGSGVLALCALKLGVGRAVGTDFDPCALAEAAHNARINGIAQRFTVLDEPAEEMAEQFHLITANLRYPTLSRLRPFIASHLAEKGAAVLSGLRDEEAEALIDDYADLHLITRWRRTENRWVGLVMVKKSPAC